MHLVLLTFHLFTFIQVRAVCFINDTSLAPLSILSSLSSVSEAACRLECLKEPECIGISYREARGDCFIHGAVHSTGICSAPIEYWKKSSSGCTEGDITAGFVPDSCLSRALLQPEYITVGLDYTQLCPGLPVEGEAVGRLYVVSVIFPNGTRQVYGNRLTLQMWWDEARSSYAIRYVDQPLSVLDEPVYAATCVYIKDDVDNTCDCPEPPPIESSALATYTDVLPLRVAPLNTCPDGYKTRVFGVNTVSVNSTTLFVRCCAGVWIYGATPTALRFNSWTIEAGACFR